MTQTKQELQTITLEDFSAEKFSENSNFAALSHYEVARNYLVYLQQQIVQYNTLLITMEETTRKKATVATNIQEIQEKIEAKTELLITLRTPNKSQKINESEIQRFSDDIKKFLQEKALSEGNKNSITTTLSKLSAQLINCKSSIATSLEALQLSDKGTLSYAAQNSPETAHHPTFLYRLGALLFSNEMINDMIDYTNSNAFVKRIQTSYAKSFSELDESTRKGVFDAHHLTPHLEHLFALLTTTPDALLTQENPSDCIEKASTAIQALEHVYCHLHVLTQLQSIAQTIEKMGNQQSKILTTEQLNDLTTYEETLDGLPKVKSLSFSPANSTSSFSSTHADIVEDFNNQQQKDGLCQLQIQQLKKDIENLREAHQNALTEQTEKKRKEKEKAEKLMSAKKANEEAETNSVEATSTLCTFQQDMQLLLSFRCSKPSPLIYKLLQTDSLSAESLAKTLFPGETSNQRFNSMSPAERALLSDITWFCLQKEPTNSTSPLNFLNLNKESMKQGAKPYPPTNDKQNPIVRHPLFGNIGSRWGKNISSLAVVENLFITLFQHLYKEQKTHPIHQLPAFNVTSLGLMAQGNTNISITTIKNKLPRTYKPCANIIPGISLGGLLTKDKHNVGHSSILACRTMLDCLRQSQTNDPSTDLLTLCDQIAGLTGMDDSDRRLFFGMLRYANTHGYQATEKKLTTDASRLGSHKTELKDFFLAIVKTAHPPENTLSLEDIKNDTSLLSF